MARLTTARRNALPSKDFAEPSQRKYPIKGMGAASDRTHAANAKGRAAQEFHGGRTEHMVDRKANAVLGRAHTSHDDEHDYR